MTQTDRARKNIASARIMLDHARLGAADWSERGERTLPGLYAALSSARTVTLALQKMSGHVDGFDDWYAPHQQALKDDPVCKWAHDLRNQVEHEAEHGEIGLVVNGRFRPPPELVNGGPPGTERFFVGGSLGRSGWKVRLPDGDLVDVFYSGPPGLTIERVHEAAPPGTNIDGMLAHVIDVLEGIVTDAEKTFLPVAPQ